MRNFQNNISNFGNVVNRVVVRQGNQLVVRIESLRSLRASRSISALYSYASELALWLRDDAWQGLSLAWHKKHVGTVACFVTAVTKQDQRRHPIMCHRTAA